MKSFLKKIALEFTGNLHTNRTKLPENSRAVLLRNDFIIVRLSHLRNPANRRAASDEKPTPGVFPRQLKIARAKPLFKKGDQSNFSNYRPISLLPSISKIFEQVMAAQLIDYFTSNNLFCIQQFGFGLGYSTELAALTLYCTL